MYYSKKLSQAEILALLNCRRLPGRLTSGQAAALLGFEEQNLPVLVASGLLGPLGNPAQNAQKFFATIDVEAAASDVKWLSKATSAVTRHWQRKNAKKRS
jgi:hypothetical protein